MRIACFSTEGWDWKSRVANCNVFSRVKRVEKGATRLEQSQSEVRIMFFLTIVGENAIFHEKAVSKGFLS